MSNKKLITTTFTFIFTIIGFISLAFSLTSYDLLLFEERVNGFSVLGGYPEILEDISLILISYSLIIILFYPGVIAGLIFLLIRKINIDKVCNGVVISTLSLTFIYMVLGFVTNSMVNEYLSKANQASTSAFVPFIIVVVLAIAYVIVKIKMPENNTAEVAKTEETAEK